MCENNVTWTRDAASIATEAQLDGIYTVRTSLFADAINFNEAVYAYKRLCRVFFLRTPRLENMGVFTANPWPEWSEHFAR